MTIIRPKVIRNRKHISKSKLSVRTATGESANVVRETVANFNIGDIAFEYRVLVAQIEEDVILVMDNMTDYRFKLDLQRKALEINGGEIVLAYRESTAASMVLAKDTRLMGRSEMIVQAYMENDMLEGLIVTLEPMIVT